MEEDPETIACKNFEEILKSDEENHYYDPVTVNIKINNLKELIEANKLLKILKTVRQVDELGRTTDEHGKTTIELNSRRHRPGYKRVQFKKKSTFPQKDGTQLVLTETPNEINVEITENLHPNSRTQLKNLVVLIQNLTEADSKVEYTPSEEGGLIATLHIKNVDEEKRGQSMRQLYRNLSVSLSERLKEVEKERRANVMGFLEDISHYGKQLIDPLGLEKLQKDIEAAYFTRELLGVLSIKIRTKNHPNGIPIPEIWSNRKSDVAMARAIGMYVMRKALKLSTTEIGRRFGYPGMPKNHATVILACKEKGGNKQFNPNTGRIKPTDYSARNNGGLKYSVEELVNDALEKYISVHPDRAKNLIMI